MYRQTGVAMMDYIRDLRTLFSLGTISVTSGNWSHPWIWRVWRSLNSAMYKFQRLLIDLLHSPTIHRLLHFGSFLCRIKTKFKNLKWKFGNLEYFLGFGWPCIKFRENQHCSGDEISEAFQEGVTTYGRCASQCIGTPGCKSFNWDHNGSDSKCYLFSSGEVPIVKMGFRLGSRRWNWKFRE